MTLKDLYKEKRRIQRETREIRKKILKVDDETDSSLQKTYGEATKTRRALKIEMFGSKSKSSGTEGEATSIENKIEQLLVEWNVKFIKQKCIRYINVDFFLLEYNIAIQCNGTYWHVDCRFYKEPNQMQKKNLIKDKEAKEVIASQKNIILVEIWEHEIKNKFEIVKIELQKILNEKPVEKFITSQDWK